MGCGRVIHGLRSQARLPMATGSAPSRGGKRKWTFCALVGGTRVEHSFVGSSERGQQFRGAVIAHADCCE